MPLHRKVLLIVLASTVLVTVLLYILAQLLVLPRFQSLEYDFITADVLRVRNEILDELDDMTTALAPNAFWDETYAFVSGDAPNYPETLVDPFFLISLDMNLVVYSDRTSSVVHSQYVNVQGMADPVPDELLTLLKPFCTIEGLEDSTTVRRGMIVFGDVVMLVIVMPVLQSNMSGTAAGTVLAAHYLNNLEVEELRSNLQLSIHLLPYPSEGTLLERLDAARTLPDGALVQIGTDDHLEAIGLVTMTDPLDNPSVIVAVKHDSAIIEQGQLTILYFAVSFLAVISLLAFVILVIVDQQILSRVARLRVRVSDLQRSAATTAPVRLSGNDEIAQFSNALEDLLETLAQANRDTAQARDEAVKALAAKTHLLANVSHDARTPLTVILLRAEMLLTERFGALTERQREMIIGVQASGKQMLFFINNLLVTAKLAADSFWLHEKSFEIQGFINEIEHFVIPLCQMQGVTLETRCASDMPLQVVADREYLKQLTFNLLDNAIKSAAGKVWLTVTRIDARYWCIQVKDNGKGISESEIMYIFDGLYHDGDKSRPKTQSTNGMGLAVVKQLSEIMNGRVNVTSDAGTGTTFVVTLPFR